MQPLMVITHTNTAQQEKKYKITKSLAMNYSHCVQKNSSKSPVIAIHRRAAANKITVVVIQSSLCVRLPLILHCNLCWPRALWGAQPASVWLELPVSRYSCPGRGEERRTGKRQASSRRTHTHVGFYSGLSCSLQTEHGTRSQRPSLSFSRVRVCVRECTDVLNVHACVWFRVLTVCVYVCALLQRLGAAG